MIPLDFLMQIGNSEYGKNRQSQNFLNDFELSDRKGTAPKPVGRHSQAILEKCDSPADRDDGPKRSRFEFQMTIPGKGH